MRKFIASWVSVWSIFFVPIPALPATVTILPMNPFGRPLSGCAVSTFRGIDAEPSRREYGSHFHGLIGRNVHSGTYKVSVRCSGTDAHGEVTVDKDSELKIISSRQDILAHDHGSPKVIIKMDGLLQNADVWWIRLIGAYNGQSYVGQFDPTTAEAKLERPRSGRYIVFVASTREYSCLREVDLATFTKVWTFQRSGCSFTFDDFAGVVGDEDRDPSRPGRIESAIQKQWNDILRSLPKQ